MLSLSKYGQALLRAPPLALASLASPFDRLRVSGESSAAPEALKCATTVYRKVTVGAWEVC